MLDIMKRLTAEVRPRGTGWGRPTLYRIKTRPVLTLPRRPREIADGPKKQGPTPRQDDRDQQAHVLRAQD